MSTNPGPPAQPLRPSWAATLCLVCGASTISFVASALVLGVALSGPARNTELARAFLEACGRVYVDLLVLTLLPGVVALLQAGRPRGRALMGLGLALAPVPLGLGIPLLVRVAGALSPAILALTAAMALLGIGLALLLRFRRGRTTWASAAWGDSGGYQIDELGLSEPPAELPAVEVLQRVRDLQRGHAQWPEIFQALNPDDEHDVRELLSDLRLPHLFAPHLGLNAIEHGCEQALAEDPFADRQTALRRARQSLGHVLRAGG
jgi:hypothetical protein